MQCGSQPRTPSNKSVIEGHANWSNDTYAKGEGNGNLHVPQSIALYVHNSPACSSVSMSQPTSPTVYHNSCMLQRSKTHAWQSKPTVSPDVCKDMESDEKKYDCEYSDILKSKVLASQPKEQQSERTENYEMVSRALAQSNESESESEDDTEKLQQLIQKLPSKKDLAREAMAREAAESAPKAAEKKARKVTTCITFDDNSDTQKEDTENSKVFQININIYLR
jgi:hypothetical protein